jgi:hypothetical protein
MAPPVALIDAVLADGWATRGGIRDGVYCASATVAKIVATTTNIKIALYFILESPF